MEQPIYWGVLDTDTGLWMGDSAGPYQYADPVIARLRAELVDIELKWAPHRCKAEVYTGGAPRLVDEIKVKVKDALKGKEEGKYL